MSTKFLSPGWRMPRNANQSKSSNYSLDFDGSSDISISGISVAGEFTLSAWVKGITSSTFYIFGSTNTSNWFRIQGGNAVNLKVGNGQLNDSSPNTIPTFTFNSTDWYCIVATRDSSNNIQVYVNGSVDSNYTPRNTATPVNANFVPNFIGRNQASYTTGQIDAVSIYDYALSESQVTTLWGGGTEVSNPMALPSPPIAYYPLGTSAWNGEYLAENNAIGDYVFYFNGASYIDLGNSSLGLTANTISIWFKTTSTTSGQQLLSKMGSTYQFQFRLETNGTISLYSFQDQSTFATLQSSSGYNDGNWHNVISTFNTTDGHKMYVDGNTTPVDTDTVNKSALQSSSERMLIGVRDSSTGVIDTARYFNGDISNTQIFNTALTGLEAETLYNYGSPIQTLANIPQSSNLKAWYKLDATEIYNSSSTEWSVDNNQNPSAYPSSLDFGTFTSNDRIVINNNFDTIITGTDFTISSWINLDSIASNQLKFIFTNESLQLTITNKITTYLRGASGYFLSPFDSNTTLSTGEWYNVVLVKSGSDYTYYLNGSSDGTVNNSTSVVNSSETTSLIGDYYGAGTLGFDGRISNTQIFNTALPETGSNSIETLYNNGTPLADMSSFSSLVSWWKLDNTTTGIEDSEGSNNGTNNGATEYPGFVNVLAGDSTGMSQSSLVQSDLQTVAPYSKYALSFDGTNDYIGIPNSTDFNLGTSFTISGWFNVTSYVSNMGYISFDSSTRGWFLFHQSTNLALYDGAAVRTLNSNLQPTNEWNSYIITYDGTDLIFYLNGQQNSTQSVSINLQTNGNDGQIGNQQFAAGRFYNGSISNISIWSASLTSAQVSEIYNEGLPSNLNSHSAYSNLVSWWQLGSNSSWNSNRWIVADEIGSNNGYSQNMSPYMPESGLTNGVGTTANGVSDNMSEGSLVGDAPYSTANALSSGMAVTARGTDVPLTPTP